MRPTKVAGQHAHPCSLIRVFVILSSLLQQSVNILPISVYKQTGLSQGLRWRNSRRSHTIHLLRDIFAISKHVHIPSNPLKNVSRYILSVVICTFPLYNGYLAETKTSTIVPTKSDCHVIFCLQLLSI